MDTIIQQLALVSESKLVGIGDVMRVAAALQKEGCAATPDSVKKRVDRVFNPRMRCPTSEETLFAIALALEWTLPEMEAALESAAAELVEG